MRKVACIFALSTALCGTSMATVSNDVVKIGVLTDLSGPYSSFAGSGSVTAAKMAIEDFGGTVNGVPVELISGDHQNRPDIGSALARQWYDVQNVDMIIDVPASAVALAVQNVSTEKNKIFINSSATTTELTGKSCSPIGVHWTNDSYGLANGTARAVLEQGDDSWFFLTVDNAGGKALESDASAEIEKRGGKVLGKVRFPLNTSDFSSFLLQAQSVNPKVVAIAGGGADALNIIKSANEFGLPQNGIKIVGLFMNITDIHAVGQANTTGLILTEAFYWDMNDKTRAFSNRFFEKQGSMPTQYHAGVYSAILHYLESVKATGTDETKLVMNKLRGTPVNDMFTENGIVRQDGRMVHDLYLMQVKDPSKSKSAWDMYDVIATIPADKAFRPLEDSECHLVVKNQ